MNRVSATRPFLFVGNHPCLDFINTELILDGRRTDILEERADVIEWLIRAKLLNANEGKGIAARLGQAEGVRLLSKAKAFRMVLREMAEQIVARKPVPQSVIATINRLLSQRPGYPQLLRTTGRVERHFYSSTHGPSQFLALLAEAASDLLCTKDLPLVKKCRNQACILFFYDTTKNHARQWCSMSICGNRMKVAAHYRRQRRGAKT
ncbi:MAG TPA: ABATE domain-containing protein [Nitrospiraceae bacterium]|jgi:predicted RNA-binding Zn ribbon-like protein|nr:ABATE domain-containing protein [Nitrospiraceae bacterium]